MMEQTGRKAPCPCGSGKKYKKCCLQEEDELAARHREEGAAVSHALDWLAHYPQQVKPGEVMELADLLHPENTPVWVNERAASGSLVRLDIFGTRLIRRDGAFVMSGAAYPFARDKALACRDEILGKMKGVFWDSDLAREIVSSHLIDRWLEGLIANRPLARVVDTSTGEPLMLTTDHYRVRDWQTLEALFAAQPDVEGNRKEGWVRFTPLAGKMQRSRAAFNPKENDTLEVFCRTLKFADEVRHWLEILAGNVLSYQIREIVDPRSEKAGKSAPAAPQAAIPPEIASQLIHNYLSKYYTNWDEAVIPVLGNKTPRQAIKTKKGRQAVIDLLKSYENGEARRVREQGGEPFDFGFLRERLGLPRE